MQKKRWHRWVLGLVLICAAICIKIGLNALTENNSVEQGLEPFEKDEVLFETVPDDFSIPIEDIEDLLDDKIIGVIYFGRDTCSFCLTLNGILKSELEAHEEIQIYKFNTDVWREDDRFQEVLDKYMITSIPALIRINEDQSVEQFIPDETASNEEAQQSLHNFLFE